MIDNGIENAATAWEVKRRIRLPGLTDAAGSSALEQTLADIDGVLRVAAEPAKQRVEVIYLVTKTDHQALEQAAEGGGRFSPGRRPLGAPAVRLVPEPGSQRQGEREGAGARLLQQGPDERPLTHRPTGDDAPASSPARASSASRGAWKREAGAS